MNTTTRQRVGLGLSGAVLVFLLADAAMHLANIDVVRTSMADLGYRTGLAPAVGVIELGCIVLCIWRRTELLGGVLLTAYLGGAVASNLRADKPLLSTVLFPVYIGLAAWCGLYGRSPQLRSIVQGMTRTERPAIATRVGGLFEPTLSAHHSENTRSSDTSSRTVMTASTAERHQRLRPQPTTFRRTS